MASLLVVCAVAVMAFVWIRGTRRNRVRWLERLQLPGAWECETVSGRLEFKGATDAGRFHLREAGREESGDWHLEGHTLYLTRKGAQPVAYDLRFFDDGKIGIDGAGLERRIYLRVKSNVVPLRGGQQH